MGGRNKVGKCGIYLGSWTGSLSFWEYCSLRQEEGSWNQRDRTRVELRKRIPYVVCGYGEFTKPLGQEGGTRGSEGRLHGFCWEVSNGQTNRRFY